MVPLVHPQKRPTLFRVQDTSRVWGTAHFRAPRVELGGRHLRSPAKSDELLVEFSTENPNSLDQKVKVLTALGKMHQSLGA